jgi:hypothetical protein
MKNNKSIIGLCLYSSIYANTQDISTFFLEKEIIKATSEKEIIFTFQNAQFHTNYSGEKSKDNSKTFDKL